MGRVLVVDDKEGIRSFIAEVLENAGHQVETAGDGDEALAILKSQSFQLLITDLKMPKMDGMALLKAALALDSQIAVIVLTAHGTVDTAVSAMKLGAYDYLTKPLGGPNELRTIVSRALAHQSRHIAVTAPHDDSMVAADPAMLQVVGLIDKVSITDATVLLLGESGTGKEVAALSIHKKSSRKKNAFIPVNCAAISETLVESEMFGHEKGAFTGATERRMGRFEQADGGTLFLDEVGELPLGLQAKLLRVLQEQKFERVGGSETIQVDVRVVAATNRHLETEIEAGRFREDLFHRLSVFPIQLPPLRERKGDIAALADHILGDIARRFKKPDLQISEEAMEKLQSYRWPGNVRELGNILERAAIILDGDMIQPEHLLIQGLQNNSSLKRGKESDESEAASLKTMEREAIKQALMETDGHRKKAAERLGIGLRTLYNKLKLYGLD